MQPHTPGVGPGGLDVGHGPGGDGDAPDQALVEGRPRFVAEDEVEGAVPEAGGEVRRAAQPLIGVVLVGEAADGLRGVDLEGLLGQAGVLHHDGVGAAAEQPERRRQVLDDDRLVAGRGPDADRPQPLLDRLGDRIGDQRVNQSHRAFLRPPAAVRRDTWELHKPPPRQTTLAQAQCLGQRQGS